MLPGRVLDMYSGIGGLTLAYEAAGFQTAAFCETNPFCQAALAHHWPGIPCYEYDHEVTLDRLCQDGIGAIDLLVGGPPCFAQGTMVLTYEGYRPIEDLTVGEMVLTHLGNWRPIIAVMRRDDVGLRIIKAQGVPGLVTTDEHPFYVRRKDLKVHHSYTERVYQEPIWKEAQNILPRTDLLGQVIPPVADNAHSTEYWWVVGRYLADGWRLGRKRRNKAGSLVDRATGRVYICSARAEADELEARLRDAGFSPYRSEERTSSRFEINNASLYRHLGCFGRYAHGKTLPGYVLSLPPNKAASLLDGYLSGDGYKAPYGQRIATTSSKSLALGMALLSQRAYGTIAGVRKCVMKSRTTIEGREVNQRDFWIVSTNQSNRTGLTEGSYAWKIVKRNESCGRGTVYNISVEGDESYLADGAIVHNCQPSSGAGKQLGASDPRWRWPEFLRIAGEVRPRVIVAENPVGLLSVGGGWLFDAIKNQMVSLGYTVGWCVYGADAVGAPHRRDRVFIIACLADPDRQGLAVGVGLGGNSRAERPSPERSGDSSGAVADAYGERRDGWTGNGGTRGRDESPNSRVPKICRRQPNGAYQSPMADTERIRRATAAQRGSDPQAAGEWENHQFRDADDRGDGEWALEPTLGADLDGLFRGLAGLSVFPAPPGPQFAWEAPRVTGERIANRAAMLTAIGNAVVPAQAYPIFKAIADLEKGIIS